MTAEFASIKEFYTDDPRRERSPEADFGVHWTDRAGNSLGWPRWRVSYVQNTGEVYAVCPRNSLVNRNRVRVLGVVPADPVTGRGDVYYRTLDKILAGWADPAVSGFDLAWVTRRLAAADLPESLRADAARRTCGDPDCCQPDHQIDGGTS